MLFLILSLRGRGVPQPMGVLGSGSARLHIQGPEGEVSALCGRVNLFHSEQAHVFTRNRLLVQHHEHPTARKLLRWCKPMAPRGHARLVLTPLQDADLMLHASLGGVALLAEDGL